MKQWILVIITAGAILFPTAVSAEDFPLSGSPRLHRILGYATMTGVVATGLLGWLAPGDLHGAIGTVTTAFAVANTGVGIVTYARSRAVPLPHLLLSTAGTVGFVANLMTGDNDSGRSTRLHSALGTASASAFALSLSWVIPL